MLEVGVRFKVVVSVVIVVVFVVWRFLVVLLWSLGVKEGVLGRLGNVVFYCFLWREYFFFVCFGYMGVR